MDDVRILEGTETSQEFTDFVAHICRDLKLKDGLLIGSFAELPLEYITTRKDEICFDSLQFCRDECAILPGEARPKNFKGTVLIAEQIDPRTGLVRVREQDCRAGFRCFSSDEMKKRPRYKRLTSYSNEILQDMLGMKNPGKLPGFSGLDLMGLKGMKLNTYGAVACLSWPREAAEWKTRRRENGWPAQDLVENVVRSGCHLVPLRDSSFSSDDNSLFRFSFARAEVALLYSWTPVQKYIYHVLLLIKSDAVKELELHGHKNLLDAYHFKTLMLWACETKPPAFWDEGCIKSSVGELLCQMIEFLVDRNCPHYFMPSVNLMNSLPESLDIEAVIMPLLVFKEQGAARLIASVPMANPCSRLTIPISNKLINLGRIGLGSVDNYAGYRRSTARFEDEPLLKRVAFPTEFSRLFNGVSAHLRLASSSHLSRAIPSTARPPSSQNAYEMAVANLEQAMSSESRTLNYRQLSTGDALPEIINSLFFADNVNPAVSMMPSGGMSSDTIDTPNSKGDRSHHDTTSQSNLRRQQTSCTTNEAAISRTEDDADKSSSFSLKPNEPTLGKIHKPEPGERQKPVDSGLQLAINLAINFIVPAFDRKLPKSSHFVSAAYSANFYYSYCHDYPLALQVCDESLVRFRAILTNAAGTGAYIHDLCSVALTPKWMPIFDVHIQAVYGFLSLANHLKRTGRKRSSPLRLKDSQSSTKGDFNADGLAHYISPLEFLDYIKMQCESKLIWYQANSGLEASRQLISSSCSKLKFTYAVRSRFILIAAIRISRANAVNQKCRTPAWEPFSTPNHWYQ